MTAQIVDGRAIAAQIRREVAAACSAFRDLRGRAPRLDIIMVDHDPSSEIYVRHKEKAAAEVGIRGEVHRREASVTTDDLLNLIARLNGDDAVDGILVQLPLPPGLPARLLLNRVSPQKDVDGLHPVNVGLLSLGAPQLVSPTPRGIMRLIADTGIDLAGKHAVVIGRGHIVGKPLAQLLLSVNATVTIAHAQTSALDELCRRADVLVAAAGSAGLVRGDWIKMGALVIDVGISRDHQGKLSGDVRFAEAAERASFITPVPGGVGPMTVACLLENLMQAAIARQPLG